MSGTAGREQISPYLNTAARKVAKTCAIAGKRYDGSVIIIRFPDSETERRGLGFLATRFPGKSWSSGETLVPEAALAHLAQQGIKFTVEGPATYEQLASLRNPAPAEVQ